MLTKPLKPDGQAVSRLGGIQHGDLIGKSPAHRIQTSTGTVLTAHHASLDEYCRLTRRLVTPIYAREANIITSLLDIHVEPYGAPECGPPLEILEAGTGHGALTLHLARAIHAANPWPLGASAPTLDGASNGNAPDGNRRALIHTVDISPDNSRHARKIVRGFRNGLYAHHVDFHIGTVGEFITAQQQLRGSKDPFLSHVILDMPSSHSAIADIVPAMRHDAKLAIFCPSITQIVDAVREIHVQRLPLQKLDVVELGAGMAAGRSWDVQVRARARVPKKPEQAGWLAALWFLLSQPAQSPRHAEEAQDLIICKPAIGAKTVAGGFLGIWSRTALD